MSIPNETRFSDGAAYDRMMGQWTRLVGAPFLDWLAPAPAWRWLDVGCGSGAFTEMIVEQCAPAGVDGIDPAEAQLAFARTRPAARVARFQVGDAMALPFADRTFDAAVMALVIFFVPDPAKGVSEMVRVVRPGGTVAAYAWDVTRGGAPYETIWDEMSRLGTQPNLPPSADASRMETLRELWRSAGLEQVETREFVADRTFPSFEDFWRITTSGTNVGAQIAGMSPADRDMLMSRVRARLPSDGVGRVRYSARTNATKGRRPA